MGFVCVDCTNGAHLLSEMIYLGPGKTPLLSCRRSHFPGNPRTYFLHKTVSASGKPPSRRPFVSQPEKMRSSSCEYCGSAQRLDKPEPGQNDGGYLLTSRGSENSATADAFPPDGCRPKSEVPRLYYNDR